MDNEKKERIISHVKSVERAHRNCKVQRHARAIRELERLRDNEALNLPRAAYEYIEQRIDKIKFKVKKIRQHDVQRSKSL